MAFPQYAAERDLQRYVPEILNYVSPNRRLEGWATHSTDVYKVGQIGTPQAVFVDGVDWGAAETTLGAVDAATEWYYDATNDILYIYLATDPNESRIEIGEDASTFMTWILERGSRLLDSMLDARLKIPTLRNRSGNFDDVIIHATCYLAAWLAIVSQNEELANFYHGLVSNAEGTGIADELNSGKRKLSRQMDIHSSGGEIISETITGSLYIVDMKGRWAGLDGDTLLVKVTTLGVIGTAQFTSYGYDSTNKTPQTQALVSAEVITGQFQHIGGGLQVKFAGATSASAAALNDRWEIAVRSISQPIEEGGFNVMEAVRV